MKPMICELKIPVHMRVIFAAKRQTPVGMPAFVQGEEKVLYWNSLCD
jgi:hypothetical protein